MNSRSDGAWFVIPPFALAGTPLDLLVVVSCVLLLAVIFVIEILTPGAVVAAFALLPLAAGMWTLSGRFAAVVLGATVLLFVGAAKAWLHLDIYAWNPSAKPGRPEGGECQAARALYALLTERYGG